MESEASTRKRRINPRLAAAGWSVMPFALRYTDIPPATSAVEERPTTAGPADYAMTNDRRVQGVVEARRVIVGPQGVLTQAERYSRGIRADPLIRGQFGVPFLCSTNGEQIHFHDIHCAQNRSRLVSSFQTPAGFAEMLSRNLDADLAALASVPVNQRLRPFQVEAIADGSQSTPTLPALPEPDSDAWPTALERWAKANGVKLPGKRVVASRLVEEWLAIPSASGAQALKQVHQEIIRILREPAAA